MSGCILSGNKQFIASQTSAFSQVSFIYTAHWSFVRKVDFWVSSPNRSKTDALVIRHPKVPSFWRVGNETQKWTFLQTAPLEIQIKIKYCTYVVIVAVQCLQTSPNPQPTNNWMITIKKKKPLPQDLQHLAVTFLLLCTGPQLILL